ncbi:hypothetical protein GOODEAATRI_032030 [Goodea atripinnis]|uniref:Uncharacterized protein n=1 Tax=Goodea atripinnis TaxID=208336 RepID=A0ABV0N629_9TELE
MAELLTLPLREPPYGGSSFQPLVSGISQYINFNEYIKTTSSCLYFNVPVVSNISSLMLLASDDKSLTAAGVLTALNAGDVAVDLRLMKIALQP